VEEVKTKGIESSYYKYQLETAECPYSPPFNKIRAQVVPTKTSLSQKILPALLSSLSRRHKEFLQKSIGDNTLRLLKIYRHRWFLQNLAWTYHPP